MKQIALGVLLAGVWLPDIQAAQDTAAPAAPNVLFIAIDDLNDWIGALAGHPQARTPHLDRLAERGVLFTNAHCPAPICNPSRTAILTGVPPHRSGLYYNQYKLREALPAVVTIPQYFREHGYRVLGAGKVFHDPDPASWDEYYPSPSQTRPPDPKLPQPTVSSPAQGELSKKERREARRAARAELADRTQFTWGPLDCQEREMGDAQVASWVARQLERTHDGPFFLACGFYRPHRPWAVPGSFFEDFPVESIILATGVEEDLEDLPETGRALAEGRFHRLILEYGVQAEAVRAYLASIAFVDAQVGHVLDALAGSAYAEETIVVLWSDHGYHLGEKQHWRKSTLWERSTRVPLIIAAPGLPRARYGGAVSLMDIYPTLIEMCGLAPRADIAGESLVPLFAGVDAARSAPALTTFGPGNHGIRSDRWRYIRYRDGGEELYDHEADPRELTNLAADEGYAEIKAALARWLPEVEAKPFAGQRGNR